MKGEVLSGVPLPSMVLPRLARWAAQESVAFDACTSPFKARFVEGDERVLLIVGANASGKSLVFRMIAQMADADGIEALTLSIRERSASGPYEMARMRRSMIFGDEETSSTGAISARVVESGFSNLSSRGNAILGFDEPEIGLSDGYAEALGEYIAICVKGMHGNACGVMLVTHSRRLAEGLVRGLGRDPAMLSMGEAPNDVGEWIKSREERSVEELLGLRTVALERFRTVNRLLGRGRKEEVSDG